MNLSLTSSSFLFSSDLRRHERNIQAAKYSVVQHLSFTKKIYGHVKYLVKYLKELRIIRCSSDGKCVCEYEQLRSVTYVVSRTVIGIVSGRRLCCSTEMEIYVCEESRHTVTGEAPVRANSTSMTNRPIGEECTCMIGNSLGHHSDRSCGRILCRSPGRNPSTLALMCWAPRRCHTQNMGELTVKLRYSLQAGRLQKHPTCQATLTTWAVPCRFQEWECGLFW